MLVDDSLHGRQPDARPLEILRPMQPLEHAKQLVGVPHVESNSVVPDEEGALTVPCRLANLDHRDVARSGVLDRVGEQVGKHDAEETWIARHR